MAAEPSRPTVRPKSYTYSTRIQWAGGRAGTLSAAEKPSFRVASPPEFKGEAGAWSPEDLFVAAVNACTMTTFLSFAERKGIQVESYASEAEGLLELVEGSFRFTRVVVRPRIRISDANLRSAAEGLVHEAHAKCLISNSVRAEVKVEADVSAA